MDLTKEISRHWTITIRTNVIESAASGCVVVPSTIADYSEKFRDSFAPLNIMDMTLSAPVFPVSGGEALLVFVASSSPQMQIDIFRSNLIEIAKRLNVLTQRVTLNARGRDRRPIEQIIDTEAHIAVLTALARLGSIPCIIEVREADGGCVEILAPKVEDMATTREKKVVRLENQPVIGCALTLEGDPEVAIGSDYRFRTPLPDGLTAMYRAPTQWTFSGTIVKVGKTWRVDEELPHEFRHCGRSKT